MTPPFQRTCWYKSQMHHILRKNNSADVKRGCTSDSTTKIDSLRPKEHSQAADFQYQTDLE
jgi:hypothetical protein